MNFIIIMDNLDVFMFPEIKSLKINEFNKVKQIF